MEQAHIESGAEAAPVAAERDAREARRLLARAESERDAVTERLRETSAALLDANQELAKIPLLEHRLEERREENVWLVGERERLEGEIERLGPENGRLGEENARLAEEVAALRAHLEALEGSRSWRLLAPLRRLRRMFRG
jgi:predicted  nucleic acid-binding Zn-ribbon protein